MQVFNTMVIIILQYINASNQHIGCLKLIQHVNYISIRFKIGKKNKNWEKKLMQVLLQKPKMYTEECEKEGEK